MSHLAIQELSVVLWKGIGYLFLKDFFSGIYWYSCIYGWETPGDFLKSICGRPVVVKLNSGVDYRGILACLDGYMNIAMEQTEEYVNGQLKNNSLC
nr:u6 snrna-associated sm-like protein lsm6 [Quercus suber]